MPEELNEYLDALKRAKADFINYQKDEEKRLEEFTKFANAGLLLNLLPFLDSWNEFEKNSKDSGAATLKIQLNGILKKAGLEKIAVSLGQKFDPLYHESIGEMESELPSGTIAEEVVSGYSLNGRILRPTRVKISKGKQNNG